MNVARRLAATAATAANGVSSSSSFLLRSTSGGGSGSARGATLARLTLARHFAVINGTCFYRPLPP